MATHTKQYQAPGIADLYTGYGGGGDRPLASYALLVSVWSGLFAGYLALSKATGKPMPRLGAGEVVLLGGATFHAARLLSKDSILSFVRAPFTRYKEPGAPGESNEEPRKDTPVQHAIGELLVCPFCLATWVAAAFAYGMGLAPAFTRLVASLFCIIGLADFLQLGYGMAVKKAEN